MCSLHLLNVKGALDKAGAVRGIAEKTLLKESVFDD